MVDEPCQMIVSKAKSSNWNVHVDSVENVFIVFIGLWPSSENAYFKHTLRGAAGPFSAV